MCDDDLRQSRFACGTSRFDTRTGEFYLKCPFCARFRVLMNIFMTCEYLCVHIMNTQPPRVFISWIMCVQSIHTHIIPFTNRPASCSLGGSTAIFWVQKKNKQTESLCSTQKKLLQWFLLKPPMPLKLSSLILFHNNSTLPSTALFFFSLLNS